MTRQVLIDNIFRQTTILIAQLATSGGVRAPLAQLADRVFLDLARELEQQGISRKVSADMFGMALRSYRRRVRQLGESSTERGRSLWEVVLEFLSRGNLITRDEVLKRFLHDEEALVKGVLNDLCESGLVLRLGSGKAAAYRAATSSELSALRERSEGLLELVWMLVYREGPIAEGELVQRISLKPELVRGYLKELLDQGRVELLEDGNYRSRRVVIPLGSAAGWEAALFDHFQAAVKTMCVRLRGAESASAGREQDSGGSTYSFSIYPGHPYEEEVRGLLREFRARHSELRQRVSSYNEAHALPPSYDRVTAYGGVCVTAEEPDELEREDEDF
ncbi:MAG TPA: hypothetical protein VFK05_19865 [Polyangiaceae bacterium]|nr:hypothetical protein [Polyangiaceae bacterium]